MSKRLEAGDRILVKPCSYYPYDGQIVRRGGTRYINLVEEEVSVIEKVVIIANDQLWAGRHLIVKLSVGTIDIWTSQDQLLYRRV